MNAKANHIPYMVLFVLPFFLLACSFTVSLDSGKKSPTPSPAARDNNTQVIDDTPMTPTPTPAPTRTSSSTRSTPSASGGQAVSTTLGTNVALDKEVITRDGGISYRDWGNANDGNDYGTTTRAEKGRWGHQTNVGGGTYEVVDLGREYTLNGVGYSLDWDGAFANPLTVQVLVSTDNESWTAVTNTIHRYDANGVSNHVNIDLAIVPTRARFVKYWEPPDGAWNGWGNFFQLRAYGEE